MCFAVESDIFAFGLLVVLELVASSVPPLDNAIINKNRNIIDSTTLKAGLYFLCPQEDDTHRREQDET